MSQVPDSPVGFPLGALYGKTEAKGTGGKEEQLLLWAVHGSSRSKHHVLQSRKPLKSHFRNCPAQHPADKESQYDWDASIGGERARIYTLKDKF